ncbi:MAG: acyltransferase domain-containing protein [Deltaproteobacteria bacterium]|nr:acyltransferase domain-containing protein [Deltaproteobacteria bacterium]
MKPIDVAHEFALPEAKCDNCPADASARPITPSITVAPPLEQLSRPNHLLTISTNTEREWTELAGSYGAYLSTAPSTSIADLCYSVNTTGPHLDHRLALIADSRSGLVESLKNISLKDGPAYNSWPKNTVYGRALNHGGPKIAFLFTGHGAQYVGMGRQLYETQPTFRRIINDCDEILRPILDQSLLSVIYPEPGSSSPLDQTAYAQPALFAIGYALAELWRSWGIEPGAVIGHSLGEYVAACVAGIQDLENGLTVSALRALHLHSFPQNGGMVAVIAPEDVVARAVQPYAAEAAIAVVNSPESVVISGTNPAIRAIVADLRRARIRTVKVNVSHPFHSPAMNPALDGFTEVAAKGVYSPPRITFISNLTGQPDSTEVTTAEYWSRQLLSTLRFGTGIETLYRLGYEVSVEIGPRSTLLGMARQCLPEDKGILLPSLNPGPRRSDWSQMLQSLAQLYVLGAPVDWAGFDRDYSRRLVALPASIRTRSQSRGPGGSGPFTAEPPTRTSQTSAQSLQPEPPGEFFRVLQAAPVAERPGRLLTHVRDQVAGILSMESSTLGDQQGFFELGMNSLTSVLLRNNLQKSLGVALPVTIAFDYPTVTSLADYLETVISKRTVTASGPKPDLPSGQPSERQARLEELSPDQIADQLARKLAAIKAKSRKR